MGFEDPYAYEDPSEGGRVMERKNTQSYFLELRNLKEKLEYIIDNKGAAYQIYQYLVENESVQSRFKIQGEVNSKELLRFIVSITYRRLEIVNALYTHIERSAKKRNGKSGKILTEYVKSGYVAKSVVDKGYPSGTVSSYIKRYSDQLHESVNHNGVSVLIQLVEVCYTVEYMQMLDAIHAFVSTIGKREFEKKGISENELFFCPSEIFESVSIENHDDKTLADSENELKFLKNLYAINLLWESSRIDKSKLANLIAIIKFKPDTGIRKSVMKYLENEIKDLDGFYEYYYKGVWKEK